VTQAPTNQSTVKYFRPPPQPSCGGGRKYSTTVQHTHIKIYCTIQFARSSAVLDFCCM